MKTRRAASLMISVFILASTAFSAKPCGVEQERSIWKPFVAALRKGEIPADRLRPYYEELRSPLQGYLKEIREKVDWAEMEVDPEVHRVGPQVHFLIPLTFEGPRVTYVFSFLTDKEDWSFQHLNASLIS